MKMNGIDISSWQAGINIEIVPCDFVIVKATQGINYINPDFNRAYNQAKAAGKCVGVYHYAGGGGAVAEADYFLENVRDCIGEAILVLDWEGEQNENFGNPAYAKEFLDRVYEKTGVKALIYMSKSVCSNHDWSDVVAADHGLWVAQYPDYEPTGYKEEPWTDGNGYGAWAEPAIFQYTSVGRLNGYGGNLDLNLAYMDRDAWNKYAGCGVADEPEQTPEEPADEAPATRYSIGDVVSYDGIYAASDSSTKLPSLYHEGTITDIIEGAANPYLIDNTTGWINYDCITDGSGSADTGNSAGDIVPGSKVRVNTDSNNQCTDYNGNLCTAWHNDEGYDVGEVSGDRAVLYYSNVIFSPFNVNDLTLI